MFHNLKWRYQIKINLQMPETQLMLLWKSKLGRPALVTIMLQTLQQQLKFTLIFEKWMLMASILAFKIDLQRFIYNNSITKKNNLLDLLSFFSIHTQLISTKLTWIMYRIITQWKLVSLSLLGTSFKGWFRATWLISLLITPKIQYKNSQQRKPQGN